jgi:hypothetical protein
MWNLYILFMHSYKTIDLWAQTSILSEMMRSCKCLQHIREVMQVELDLILYINVILLKAFYSMFTLLKGITENNIGKKGAEAICDALKTNNYLRKLDLSGNLHIYWYISLRMEVWAHKSIVLPRHFLLKWLYKARKVNGHVFVYCLKWVIYFDRVYQIQLNLKP